jgi:hypothetical protein
MMLSMRPHRPRRNVVLLEDSPRDGGIVGLSWQQGPLSPGAIGRFLIPEPLSKRLLYAEPLRRRMRVRFGGTWIADSENVVLLFEPGRYPVAYFPETDVAPGTIERTGQTCECERCGPCDSGREHSRILSDSQVISRVLNRISAAFIASPTVRTLARSKSALMTRRMPGPCSWLYSMYRVRNRAAAAKRNLSPRDVLH